MGEDGMHALIPGGEAPSEEEVAEMTKVYQEQIRKSAIWAEMRNVHRAGVVKQ